MKEDVPMRAVAPAPGVAFACLRALKCFSLNCLRGAFQMSTGNSLRAELHALSLSGRIGRALEAICNGRAVLLFDDDDRENEADLIVAAERLTEATMALMIREGSGIVCLCLPDATLRRLELPPMVARNECRHGTAFTVSIDARDGITTGVSAADRVTTIRTAIADGASPADLVSPGHVFPLRAVDGGVLERRGHTEGAMAHGQEVERFARLHALPMLTIAELVAWRHAREAASV
jgi:3,4-dihydroxy 2-butanone 4-phosphate synthase